MQNKKGAIELSMTTIIVIVIGVTLLSLALVWVRGVFTNLGDISDDAFKKARDIIGRVENVDKLLTVIPSETSIEQGGDEAIKIVVANLGQTQIAGQLTASPTSDGKLDCFIFNAEKEGNRETDARFNLNSGEQKSFSAIIKDNKGAIRTTGCTFKVTGPQDPDNERSVIVRVIKE